VDAPAWSARFVEVRSGPDGSKFIESLERGIGNLRDHLKPVSRMRAA
jgi:hypothetical protein